ncbi:MAG: hypothetical protein ACE5IY_01890 [bacterium]
MLLYDRTALRNLTIQNEATRWHDSQVISQEQIEQIHAQYPCDLHRPNFFIQVTLFLATLVTMLAGWGLISLFYFDVKGFGYGLLLISYGTAAYKFLEEIIIKKKGFFRAGLDDALIIFSCGFIVAGLFWLLHARFSSLPVPVYFLIALPVLAWFAVRFAHPVMTAAIFFAFFATVFSQLLELGFRARSVLPFLMMLLSVPIYWSSNRAATEQRLEPWHQNLLLLKGMSLVMFYLAGNYLVVRELSAGLLAMPLAPGEDIPLAFIFYGCTALIPPAYIVYGLKTRDVLCIRIGLFVLAASVLTLEFYVSLGPPELTLTAAGALMILLAVTCLRLLDKPLNGYTRKHLLRRMAESLDAEAFLIAETMAATPETHPPVKGTKFGGGESGGAGAEGDY